MPRFVLLYHDCPSGFVKPSHWDFMLEREGVLWTWELRTLPRAWCEALDMISQEDIRTVTAQRLADHRIDYLEYEGPLTNGRGSVKRVASGEFEVLEDTPQSLVIRLNGVTIRGIIELGETGQLTHWQLRIRESTVI